MNRSIARRRASRRGFIAAAATFAAAQATRPAGAADAPSPAREPIEQPTTPNDATFIARAYRERHDAASDGDQPYGAVVVRGDRIIGAAGSWVVRDKDPTAHAEMLAIRDALAREGRGTLAGAVLYSSSRACPMCEAAAYFVQITRLVHGRARDDEGAPQLCRRV